MTTKEHNLLLNLQYAQIAIVIIVGLITIATAMGKVVAISQRVEALEDKNVIVEQKLDKIIWEIQRRK